MPAVGALLRRGGAVFIRRTFGDDQLYKAVFAEYIHVILASGHMLEVYIEGQFNVAQQHTPNATSGSADAMQKQQSQWDSGSQTRAHTAIL